MDLTPEQIEKLYQREVPDVKICLHEMRIQPMKLPIDNDGKPYGYIARMVGHSADGKPMLIDFVTSEVVLQETMTRLIEAGMTAAFAEAMDAANDGDPRAVIEILTIANDEIKRREQK